MKSQLERTSAIADMLGFRLLVIIAKRNTSWSSLVPDQLRIWVTGEEKPDSFGPAIPGNAKGLSQKRRPLFSFRVEKPLVWDLDKAIRAIVL
jgi:hypothetical protein